MAYGDFSILVGEEVGITRVSRYGGYHSSRFGTVIKINGHGHIYVRSGEQELRFTRTGKAYKDEWGPRLIHAAQLRAHLAQEERGKAQSRIAHEIEKTIKDGFSYSGRFFSTKERVNNLKRLVCELESFVENE
jgi:hypothetical protein